MASLRDQIFKAIAFNSQQGNRMVPVEIIVANCQTGGNTAEAAQEELAVMIEDGELCEVDDHYDRATNLPTGDLRLDTYRGGEGTPWQFALERTADELVIEQARGPPEKFDPVVKRFAIEERVLGPDPLEFEHAVSRRVWDESPEQPAVRSQRQEGRVVEFLYRDPEGRHLVRPEPQGETAPDATLQPTDHEGITVDATYLRHEDETDCDTRYVGERTYRVSQAAFDTHAEVYVLTYDVLNEESEAGAVWDVENAVAHRLIPATRSVG
jgi:hypothetical protein